MNKWEYEKVEINHDENWKATFNDLGQNQWELVDIEYVGNMIRAVFKRPISEKKQPFAIGVS